MHYFNVVEHHMNVVRYVHLRYNFSFQIQFEFTLTKSNTKKKIKHKWTKERWEREREGYIATHWTKTLRRKCAYILTHLLIILYAAPKCCRIAAPARIESKRYIRKQNKNKNSFGRKKKKKEQYLLRMIEKERTNQQMNKCWEKKMHNQKKRSTKYNIRINCFRFH